MSKCSEILRFVYSMELELPEQLLNHLWQSPEFVDPDELSSSLYRALLPLTYGSK